MSQIAENILIEDQDLQLYLQIVGNESPALADDLSRVPDNFFNEPLIADSLFEKVAPFYYKERVRLSFSVSPEFRKHFAMIRGLVEFNRSKQFSFNYDFSQRTIETDIEVGQTGDIHAFLGKVSLWLKQEIQFKTALKIVRDFEHRYKAEMESVYGLLNNTAAAIKKR